MKAVPVPQREQTDDFVYLTTIGRRSGTPHEIEIWYAESDSGRTLYLLAGGGRRADWVANLVADPNCHVRLMGRTFDGIGRLLDEAGETDAPIDGDAPIADVPIDGETGGGIDPVEERFARDAVFAKYEPRNPGLTSWRESALPVAIDLLRPARTAAQQ